MPKRLQICFNKCPFEKLHLHVIIDTSVTETNLYIPLSLELDNIMQLIDKHLGNVTWGNLYNEAIRQIELMKDEASKMGSHQLSSKKYLKPPTSMNRRNCEDVPEPPRGIAQP